MGFLATLAIAVFLLEQWLSLTFLLSAALTVIGFALLDLFLVDRRLEPWLEARRFRALRSATNDAIDTCRSIEENPHHLAALLDGVIEQPN
jgi:hypothetical protein